MSPHVSRLGTPQQREIRTISPQALTLHMVATGSQGPQVRASCAFVLATGGRAVIGSLEHIDAMLAGQSGTQICIDGSDV